MIRLPYKKTRIMIIHPFDPFGLKVGGIETCIKNIITRLPSGMSVELVGVSSDHEKRPAGKWGKYRLNSREFRFLPILSSRDENKRAKIPLALAFVFALFRYRKMIRPKERILQFHRIEPSIGFIRNNNKKILFIHGNTGDLYNRKNESRWSRIPAVYFLLEALLIKRFSRVYIVSENGVQRYKEKFPGMKEKISFLPAWFDSEVFYPKGPGSSGKRERFLSSLGYGPDSICILFSGRLEKVKDPFLLLDVFRIIHGRIPRAKLIISGTGSLVKRIRKAAEEYGIMDDIYLAGALNQHGLSGIMRVCDVFLLTSAFEGMPRSVLEALACGIPVVTTDVGEVSKVVRDNFSGFISRSRDPEEICRLVIKIIGDKEGFCAERCLESVKAYRAENILSKVYGDYERL